MINFYPLDNNAPGNLINFNWNYPTYWGDGIPLLFWVFAYPYGCYYTNGLSATQASANEYRWAIENLLLQKSTRFVYGTSPESAQNSFFQFPSNSNINSNVLYNLTRGNNTCGPYNFNHAVIIVDSPWARSCEARVPAAESKKNENFAVGLSKEMGFRIARTFPNWSQWWDATNTNCGCSAGNTLSLLPEYLKNALSQVKGTSSTRGGIQSLDILMFDPLKMGSYLPSEEQAGLVVPELRGGGAAGEGAIRATQCFINEYSFPVNPFGKAFVGAFVAIYKDYTEYNVSVVNNLLIDVPWSGALTGVTSYKMNSTLTYPQCSLSCPVPLQFKANGKRSFCDGSYMSTNYPWASNYPAPHTFPRTSCLGGDDPFDRCSSLELGGDGFPNNWINNDIWESATPDSNGFKFNVKAGDGLSNIQACGNGVAYPSYFIGFNSRFPVYNVFDPIQDRIPYRVLPRVGPWQVEYILDFSRFQIAGGGCQNASFFPWTP
jgi:hypothetical protein